MIFYKSFEGGNKIQLFARHNSPMFFGFGKLSYTYNIFFKSPFETYS